MFQSLSDALRCVPTFLILALVLVGCGGSDTVRTETVAVTVPVPTAPPKVEMPARPFLPIARVDSTSTPREVVRAYAATVRLLQGYSRELEATLRPYADSTSVPGGAGVRE